MGKTLGLDVGIPNEAAMMATGQLAPTRDALGIALDTRRFASKKCNTCYGRGLFFQITHVPVAAALKLIKENPANEALLHQTEPGKYHTRQSTMCGCARRRYEQAYERFASLLVSNKLAIHNQVQKRYELV